MSYFFKKECMNLIVRVLGTCCCLVVIIIRADELVWRRLSLYVTSHLLRYS